MSDTATVKLNGKAIAKLIRDRADADAESAALVDLVDRISKDPRALRRLALAIEQCHITERHRHGR